MTGVIDSSLSNYDISSCKLQEINDLLTMLKKEKKKLVTTEIFKDIILETTGDRSNGMRNMLAVKIRDIILRRELVNNLKIRDVNELSLLDIEKFINLELTFDEQKELKMFIEQKLKEKKESLLKDIKDITDCDITTIHDIIENIKYNTGAQKDNIIEQEKIIRELHKCHISEILKLGDLLIKLLNVKTELGPKTMEEKAEQLFYETEKINLRTKIIELKSQISMFKDSPLSVKAYQIAYKDLKEQQNTYSKQIDELQTDIEKYIVLVRNEEYQEILKDYKQYLKSIENQKWLQNEILKK